MGLGIVGRACLYLPRVFYASFAPKRFWRNTIALTARRWVEWRDLSSGEVATIYERKIGHDLGEALVWPLCASVYHLVTLRLQESSWTSSRFSTR
jgi:hypothetical protein